MEVLLPPGTAYRSGEYLAVLPLNPRESVRRVMNRFRLHADDLLAGDYMTAAELFGARVELATPASQHQVATLAEKLSNNDKEGRGGGELLKVFASDEATYRSKVLERRASVLDLEISPTASSPLPISNPGAFARSSSETTTDGDESSTSLTCSITYAKFRLPQDPKTPVIFIAAGTGIAPMRAFIQERAAIAGARGGPEALGPAVLFFGCRDFEEDFLYGEELAGCETAGVVVVRTAFSRRGPPGQKMAHVDEVLWDCREELKGLFKQRARILLCGSAARLGRSVHEICVRVYQEAHPEVGREEAEGWLLQQKEDRHLRDVFG
ncbi:ferredoxin reductase-like protein [Cryphonectria parasitica EP155]|uniref:Ferredoxin reductase-like protein n=1 Tax=Cryphonectria parasitica (strain ATCC 38755 / EP155) TaxID=660469 RepID=A0A9P4Y9G2_CRYP1|nr:ferredoxin reductase-like protein [Cryphonectria parasitica EP155]KAF3769258.1 ferredoxin reductase-like protein [Cryphonectria parasitica EP155]